jgi:hypothetical protein
MRPPASGGFGYGIGHYYYYFAVITAWVNLDGSQVCYYYVVPPYRTFLRTINLEQAANSRSRLESTV